MPFVSFLCSGCGHRNERVSYSLFPRYFGNAYSNVILVLVLVVDRWNVYHLLPVFLVVYNSAASRPQDFDEKRREWRRTKKNVINAISEMSARALKFECSEKKTIALHAIQFYKVRQVCSRVSRFKNLEH